MTIKRDRYLNRLIERRHNGFVKIITGIRRCGKSFLLFNLFRDYLLKDGVKPAQVVEVALDMRKFAALKDPIALGDYIIGKIRGRARIMSSSTKSRNADGFFRRDWTFPVFRPKRETGCMSRSTTPSTNCYACPTSMSM